MPLAIEIVLSLVVTAILRTILVVNLRAMQTEPEQSKAVSPMQERIDREKRRIADQAGGYIPSERDKPRPFQAKDFAIKAMSQGDTERWTLEPHPERTAIISITNPWEGEAVFGSLNECGVCALLRTSFDDCQWDEPDSITEQQAAEIARFIYDLPPIDLLIIHCEMGKSRSVAIEAAILDHQDIDDIPLWFAEWCYPNITVFCMVKDALEAEKNRRLRECEA